MSTLHGVLGNVLPDYLTGAATAKATLEKIEADYITSATEKEILDIRRCCPLRCLI
jgi:hypothetical protein